MTYHDHRQYVVGCYRCELSHQESALCQEVNLAGLPCHRDVTHDGPHIHFGASGTTAWEVLR